MSKARGLADLGNAYSDGALSNRNLIINGAMQVAQRGTSVTVFTGGNYATLDRFYFEANAGTYTLSQGTSGPSGFPNTFKVEATGASSTQIVNLQHRIEGGSLQPLGFGTADAKELTASFWVKTNVTGTYTLELYNGDATRQVSKNYTVNSSGTWEYKTITLPSDTSSGFDNDANLSLYMVWWLAAPSTHTSGTQNTSAWASASTANRVSPSIVDIGDTVGNYFEITGVQLEVGDTATPFEHRSYSDELQRCQRYYQVFASTQNDYPLAFGYTYNTGSKGAFTVPLAVPMRADPTWAGLGHTTAAYGNGTTQETITTVNSIDSNDVPIVTVDCNFATNSIGNAQTFMVTNTTTSGSAVAQGWGFALNAEL